MLLGEASCAVVSLSSVYLFKGNFLTTKSVLYVCFLCVYLTFNSFPDLWKGTCSDPLQRCETACAAAVIVFLREQLNNANNDGQQSSVGAAHPVQRGGAT